MKVISDETPFTGLIFTAPDWIWPGSGAEPMDPAFAESYRMFVARLLRHLPVSVDCTVVTHKGAADAMRNWLEAHSGGRASRVVAVEDTLRFTVWASDILVFAEEDGAPVVLSPCEFPRSGDALLAGRIAGALGLRNVRSDLFFQGGNLIACRRGLLVGADDITALANVRPRESRASIAGRYAQTLGYPASTTDLGVEGQDFGERRRAHETRPDWTRRHYPGNPENSMQPVYHIDLCVTVLGGARLAVGDVKLAGKYVDVAPVDTVIAEGLDAVADQLSGAGYDITRVPLAFLPIERPDMRQVTTFAAPSLNVVADFGSRTVFVPMAADLAPFEGLSELDAVHLALWRDAGFAPVPVDGLAPVFRRLGGPRCLVKAVPDTFQWCTNESETNSNRQDQRLA
ncbi:MAG: hypothetical protein QNJ44_08935 [Rhodobacter sp.]|nr:hypothetical protein [Rhodobacter sp.]